MPDQTEENADGQVTIKMYQSRSRTSGGDAMIFGLTIVFGVAATVAALGWFVVLPVIGLLWACGWLP